MKIFIFVCLNEIELRDYFYNMLQFFNYEKGFSFDEKAKTITTDHIKYIFLTPDRPESLIGLRIMDWTTLGEAYQHPFYSKFIQLLLERKYADN